MGRTVFLSAGLPDETQPDFLRYGVRPRAVDEAVTALTVALLRRDMRMVFGGQRAISPLVAMAALQLRGWGGTEPPILIYQSRLYEKVIPEAAWRLFHSGAARIVWTDPAAGDDFRNNTASLLHMRTRMLKETQPDAIVCIGGMQGIVDELSMFQDLREGVRDRCYLLAGTGGATAMLAQTRFDVAVLDGRENAFAGDEMEDDVPIPYPFLLSRLADRLALLSSDDQLRGEASST